MSELSIQEQLAAPFEESDVEWRVMQSGVNNSGPWVQVAPYVTNRAVQQRLDDVLGPGCWENVYRDAQGGQICGLRLKIGEDWITKWDGAGYTDFESLKGAISGSMKRAAVQWGIGRYLYAVKSIYVPCQALAGNFECTANYVQITQQGQNGPTYIAAQWETPELPEWALPQADFAKYLNDIHEAPTLTQLATAFGEAMKCAEAMGEKSKRKAVIEARNTRQKAVEQEQKAKRTEAVAKFKAWLNEAVRNLESTVNETLLDMEFKRVRQELQGQCKALSLTDTEYLNRINQVKQSQLSKFQGA
ncbi:Rad52/Rad22 family DNA repair protein [Pseudoalteromonas rubra]|uniref:Rad52/Rad22 family DNA repair protein n=1 Tax=Pseudoalteromonas rubra TaxID=43658 RepID=UPI000F77D1CC|nr:Rad52/Rad22 family DNA repair protein [Pseudoalteromonas rubra]